MHMSLNLNLPFKTEFVNPYMASHFAYSKFKYYILVQQPMPMHTCILPAARYKTRNVKVSREYIM